MALNIFASDVGILVDNTAKTTTSVTTTDNREELLTKEEVLVNDDMVCYVVRCKL